MNVKENEKQKGEKCKRGIMDDRKNTDIVERILK